jgi:4-carboxymuconolactone decarboxylase
MVRVVLLLALLIPASLSAQSRLGATDGVAAIRMHRSGVDVRWENNAGRALSELAILSTAREHDQPYEWSLHEMEAIAVGLDPAVIDIVRNRKPLVGIGDKEITIIQLAREIGAHRVTAETYSRALTTFGEKNLVDIAALMGQYAATATRLTAVNQQMPPGWKQFLPLLFTPPSDIHPDSRSRLPVIRTPAAPPTTPPPLYSRGMAPEGTGPTQIARRITTLAALETRVGRPLIDIAALVAARAHDQQYDWTMTEIAAHKDGVASAVIEVIRDGKPTTGLGAKESTLIEFGRQLFGKHYVDADLYARALQLLGEGDLVNLVNVFAVHAEEATLLTVFDQQLPVGQKPLLPMP